MATYNDFFMRPNLTTTPYGSVPSSPPLTSSPDIIPQQGTSPIGNFQTVLATDTSYGQDIGQDLLLQQNNLIYVRAKNGSAGAQTGTINLFYVPSAIINWPSQWVHNQLSTDQGASSAKISAANAGDVAVGDHPFQWTPQPPPAGSDHYCLISQVVTPTTPNAIPGQNQPMTYEDMATLVSSDLGIGWRNVALVDGSTPTWTYNTMLTVPSNNPTAAVVHVYLACNVPVNTAVAFACSTLDGTSAPITIPQTTVTVPNQISGVTVTLQPGFSGSIAVSFFANGQTLSSGQGLTLEAAYEAPQHLANKFVHHRHRARLANAVGIQPQNPVYLGNMSFVAR